MSVPVVYRVSPLSPHAHVFEVTLTVSHPAKKGQVFSLPCWIPGSYMIREFARNIVSISARCNGQQVELRQLDKHTWQADPVDGVLELRYSVYAFDLSVRGAYLDGQRGFFNPTSLCLSVEGYEQSPCDIEVLRPRGADYKSWRLATGLSPRNGKSCDAHGFGCYRAESYDALIDHPFELGTFERLSFKACGVEHELVVSGRYSADLKRLARDVKKICQSHIRLFGEPAPFERYVFMLYVGRDIYGGLEHRNSTALMAERDDLPQSGQHDISDGYLRLLGLFSHEYFHAWNVKRIKPAAFTPYDLGRENYTRLLWAFEGITSYYDDLALLRAGLIDRERYLGLLAQTLTAVERGPGRNKQTLEASSFDAWVKYYRQDENSPNSIVSYYAKGALAALGLDLLIRQKSTGACSLDDVMRGLWRKWLDDGLGLEEQQWEALASEYSGVDLSAYFDLALRSTEPLPLAELLAGQGVDLQWTAAAGSADKGGVGAAPAVTPRLSLGVKSCSDPLGVKLQHVYDGGAAQSAGLAAGDVLVAIAGLRVFDLERALARLQPGEPVAVHAFRRDELLTFDVTPKKPLPDTCRLNMKAPSGNWPEH